MFSFYIPVFSDQQIVKTIIAILLLVISGCSYFKQNDFVTTEVMYAKKNEKVVYEVYRTGIDNYRLEFKSVYAQDTARLFEYYINDAVFSPKDFTKQLSPGRLKIMTTYPTATIYCTTGQGLSEIFEHIRIP